MLSLHENQRQEKSALLASFAVDGQLLSKVLILVASGTHYGAIFPALNAVLSVWYIIGESQAHEENCCDAQDYQFW